MIIGISGKSGSGKDTVGKIIQYLNSPFDQDFNIPFDINENYYSWSSEWKIKKFADSLKGIICLLIGCTREQLEDREFKEKELAEEWWYWENSFGKRVNYLDNVQYAKPDSKSRKLVKLTPRLLLQLLGTECGRNIIHPNIWVNALMNEYQPFIKGVAHDLKDYSELYTHKSCQNCKKSYSGYKRQYFCKKCIEDSSVQFYPNWIITDVRFPNETKDIKDRGGIIIRVNRERFRCSNCSELVVGRYNCQNCGTDQLIKENYSNHISEISLDKAKFDYTIDNNGTIEELIKKVKEILIKENII